MDMLLDRKTSLQVQCPVQTVCAAAGPGLSLVNLLCKGVFLGGAEAMARCQEWLDLAGLSCFVSCAVVILDHVLNPAVLVLPRAWPWSLGGVHRGANGKACTQCACAKGLQTSSKFPWAL